MARLFTPLLSARVGRLFRLLHISARLRLFSRIKSIALFLPLPLNE